MGDNLFSRTASGHSCDLEGSSTRQVCNRRRNSSFSIPRNVMIPGYLTALAEEPNLLSCAFLWERKHLFLGSSFQIYHNLKSCWHSRLQELGFHLKPRGFLRQLLNLLDSPKKHSDRQYWVSTKQKVKNNQDGKVMAKSPWCQRQRQHPVGAGKPEKKKRNQIREITYWRLRCVRKAHLKI